MVSLFNQDAFNSLGLYLDGYDACQLRLVCRAWRNLVDKSADLSWKRRVHLVMLEDIGRLDRTLAKNPLRSLSTKESTMWIQNIMWYRYEHNILNTLPEDKGHHTLDMRFFCLLFGGELDEGFRSVMQNTETRELVFVNNYYGLHAMCCYFSTKKCYSCTPADHFVERVAAINAEFPGLIVNWKLIHFPFLPDERHRVSGQDFHRGTSVCITVGPGWLQDVFDIGPNLRRMHKAMPKAYGYTGTGKKRRMVKHPFGIKNPVYDLPKYHVLLNTMPLEHVEMEYIHDTDGFATIPYAKYLKRPDWAGVGIKK